MSPVAVPLPDFLLRRWKLLLLAILAVAALLRLPNPELTNFNSDDELRDYHQAILLVKGEVLPTTGPALFPYGIQGFVPGSFYYYLVAIPYSVSKNPAAAIFFLNLLNVLAVAVFFFLIRRMFDLSTALIASLVFAVSPWAILFGRGFIHHYFGLFFGLLFLSAAWSWLQEKKPWAFAILLPLLAALIQIHTIFAVFGVFLVLLVPFFRPRLSVAPPVVGFVLFAAVYAPWWLPDALHGWTTLRPYFDAAKYGSDPSHLNFDMLKALLHPWIMGTGELSYFTRHETLGFYGFPGLFFWLVAGAILLSLAFQFGGARHAYLRMRSDLRENGILQGARRSETAALLFWAILVLCFVGVLIARKTTPHPKYLAPILPASALLIALFFTRSNLSARLRVGAFAGLAFVSFTHVALVEKWFQARRQGVVFSGLSRAPLSSYLDACRFIFTDSKGRWRIEGEPEVLVKDDVGVVRPFSTFMDDWLGSKPSSGAATRTYLAGVEENGWTIPAEWLRRADAIRRFGGVVVVRVRE